MNRYKVIASFQEEQRKGFVVTHSIEKEYETADELTQGMGIFLSKYNSEFCHHLDFHVVEVTAESTNP